MRRRGRGRAADELPGERARTVLMFCVLGGVAVTLAVRLAWLQLGPHRVEAAERVEGNRVRFDEEPAPRCRIYDRTGRTLAYDRPVWEAWGEVYLRLDAAGTVRDRQRVVETLASDLVLELSHDARVVEDEHAADRLRELLRTRIEMRLPKRLARLHERVRASLDGKLPREVRVDFPICLEFEDAVTALGLQDLDVRRAKRKQPYRLYVHLDRRYERVYADRALTAGIVGYVRDERTDELRQIGVKGLETIKAAGPRRGGARLYSLDARSVQYFTPRRIPPDKPFGIRTTVDLELQRAADRELDAAVEHVTERYGSPPEWGALVAVDVRTGGLLAMASFSQRGMGRGGAQEPDHDWTGAFAPTQFLFEMGSVVKPLVLALALERGAIDWEERIDCSGTLWLPLDGSRRSRAIRDSHPCGVLTPREVLINSSNIGAVRLGLRLGAQGLEDYLVSYGFREEVGLPLGDEPNRGLPKPIPELHRREQEVYTAPSLCYGYNLSATVTHLARAYLTFLSGRPRGLRLVDAIEVDGEWHRVPHSLEGERFLSKGTVALVVEALTAMVDGAPGATAARLTHELGQLGAPRGLIAGKTGTSEYPPRGTVKTRTASFAGFAPASAPRVLAVCVIQKKGAATFYGGTYAAPAAGRLLLQALQRVPSERARVSASQSESAVRGARASFQKGR